MSDSKKCNYPVCGCPIDMPSNDTCLLGLEKYKYATDEFMYEYIDCTDGINRDWLENILQGYSKEAIKQAKLEVADMYIGIVKALAESGDAQCAVNLAKQLKQQIESE